ncbi:hypothetical protein B296_00054012 [Ensete ventricosum]|uniref:Uncharacterized protein n=1 Tax=Ensete ventricosum TaxID=4639 RepID=A0A426WZJ9_ENSVE|nr:hypothetical protein B296_00054012 [Ensete ventricosum]
MGVLKPIKPLNSISLEVDGSSLHPCGVGDSIEPKIVLRVRDPPDRVSFFPSRKVNLHAWIIEIRDDTMGARREFAGGHQRFEQCYRELTENSPEVCWEVRREFTDRLSGARREFAGRMLEVRWEFAEGN